MASCVSFMKTMSELHLVVLARHRHRTRRTYRVLPSYWTFMMIKAKNEGIFFRGWTRAYTAFSCLRTTTISGCSDPIRANSLAGILYWVTEHIREIHTNLGGGVFVPRLGMTSMKCKFICTVFYSPTWWLNNEQPAETEKSFAAI